MKYFVILLAALFLNGHAVSADVVYSEAVVAGDYIYVSGQFPIDSTTGKIVEEEMVTLTNLVLDRIQHILHNKGFRLNQVIKTDVYLTDIRDLEAVNSVFLERFPSQYPPARNVIIAADLPNNSRIEIACTAYRFR